MMLPYVRRSVSLGSGITIDQLLERFMDKPESEGPATRLWTVMATYLDDETIPIIVLGWREDARQSWVYALVTDENGEPLSPERDKSYAQIWLTWLHCDPGLPALVIINRAQLCLRKIAAVLTSPNDA